MFAGGMPPLLKRLFLLAVIILFLAGSVSKFTPAIAAPPDSLQVLAADSRVSEPTRYTVTLKQTATTAFESGETIVISFPSGFIIPPFTPSDVSFNDGTTRTILSICVAGTNNIGLTISGQNITFTACSGFVSSPNGATVTMTLGSNSTKITNPTISSVYIVETSGTYGDNLHGTAVAITTGTTFSLTILSSTGNVRFTGDAFPDAFITILDASAVIGTTTANPNSFFDKTITGLQPGVHTFGVFGQAIDGRKTLTVSFDLNVLAGQTITVSGLLLPPIVTVPLFSKRPAVLPQNGLAKHNATITTFTNSHSPITRQTTADSQGQWQINITDVLHLGGHSTSAKVVDGGGNQSVLTNPVNFEILLSADLNIDNLVNLTDFSILMFNYGTSNPPNMAADINDSGGLVDLVDFSIMMFYWTGG